MLTFSDAVCSIGLHHPLDGVTNPKYNLLCSLSTSFFCKEKKTLAFNQNRCCHLALCLRPILFHWRTNGKFYSIGLHHPLDGVTSPEYKLLHFIAFNQDRCCHLALCLRPNLFHWRTNGIFFSIYFQVAIEEDLRDSREVSFQVFLKNLFLFR